MYMVFCKIHINPPFVTSDLSLKKNRFALWRLKANRPTRNM